MKTPTDRNTSIARGARGGNAIASGQGSTAIGGDAGPIGLHPGGRGGDVFILVPHTTAIGGIGGGGGIGPGMPGMDIIQPDGGVGDYMEGGMGGEADQPDGRGGRGGRAGGYDRLVLGQKPRPHMKVPYWEDNVIEPGRGGDRPDTPRYRARRLIIEMLKAEYLGASAYFTTEVWYAREAVPADILNSLLEARGHRWKVAIVADEYAISEGEVS
jgi:hypothetical protein